jgi:hypothetical protein
MPLERAIEPERRRVSVLASARHEHPEPRGQPTADELEHALGRAIQPLHVVDRDDEWTLCFQCCHDAQERGCDRARVSRRRRLPPQQRHLERLALRRRKLAAHFIERTADEISECGVRERCLGLCWVGVEHAIAKLLSRTYRLQPESCLANPGLALDCKRDRAVRHALDKACDSSRLVLASNHVDHSGRTLNCHAACKRIAPEPGVTPQLRAAAEDVSIVTTPHTRVEAAARQARRVELPRERARTVAACWPGSTGRMPRTRLGWSIQPPCWIGCLSSNRACERGASDLLSNGVERRSARRPISAQSCRFCRSVSGGVEPSGCFASRRSPVRSRYAPCRANSLICRSFPLAGVTPATPV